MSQDKWSSSPAFGHAALRSQTATAMTTCNLFLRPALPVSHMKMPRNVRQSRWKTFNGFSAIQSVYVNIQIDVMSVTDSEVVNNEMPHYHNFPDLDEWFSHSGCWNGALSS